MKEYTVSDGIATIVDEARQSGQTLVRHRDHGLFRLMRVHVHGSPFTEMGTPVPTDHPLSEADIVQMVRGEP